ncbi:MAG: transporter substrate-binding domain-containing protein [Paracoccaceae bacterium]
MKTLILSTAALALSAGFAMADTVRMGTEGAYPPYNFIDDKGEVAGFEREVGDELCKRAELTCEWVTNEWDSIIPNLVSGNYDTIIAAMSINDERRQNIDFTTPYFPPAASAYLSMNAEVPADAMIAAQTNTIQSEYVAQSGATLVEFDTIDDAVAAAKNGEADAVFGDKEVLRPFAEGQGLAWAGEEVFLDEGIGVGVRKSDGELKEKLNAAIDSMKADGSLNALLVKHFGAEAQTF